SVDMIVPFAFAGSIKAARVASVTMGRIRLMEHEAKDGSRIGGHTIEKHVGRTEAQLRERMRLEPQRDVVSSFRDLPSAEWAISRVMESNTLKIRSWAQSNPRQVLTLFHNAGETVGYGINRETGKLMGLSTVQVVLKYEKYNGMPYYILTSYLLK
ncbi:conserved hypothetical protein, partial [Burkholderia sp. H160]